MEIDPPRAGRMARMARMARSARAGRTLTSLAALGALVSLAACGEPTPTPATTSTGKASTSAAATKVASDVIAAPTKSPDEARFVAVGDTGKGGEGQLVVARAMTAWCQAHGCDFVVLLGDNIYPSGVASVDDPAWQRLFEVPYAALDVPFFAALGNHDYGRNGLGNDFARGPMQIAYTARSKKWKMPAEVYRVDAGPVDVLVLDTNALLWGHEVVRPEGQRARVRRLLEGSKAPFRLAVGHHPYLSNGPHGNAGRYDDLPDDLPIGPGKQVKAFFDAEVCGKVELYVAGHDHSRQWLEPTCKGTELAVSGAGSAPTPVEPRNPARYSASGFGFLYVVATREKLEAKFVGAEGQIEHERTLTKLAKR